MAELIVALDAPDPFNLYFRLFDAGLQWFKIGPQMLTCGQFDNIIHNTYPGGPAKFFLDLKLADTADTCREAAKRFADAGVAAVSTFTDRATESAMRGAEGSPLRVWRVLRLTDGDDPMPRSPQIGDGVICSVADLHAEITMSDIDKVCPGIRFREAANNHRQPKTPSAAAAAGATHIVVGRPIWQVADPVAAAREYLSAVKYDQGAHAGGIG